MKDAIWILGFVLVIVAIVVGVVWLANWVNVYNAGIAAKDRDHHGWTFVMADQGGGDIWKKCNGKDLFFEDTYKNDITVVIGGCGG